MTRLIVIGLTIGAIALPAVMAPTAADAATCRSRKATGTVLGGLGGALIGNSISHGGGGLLVGGVGGALLGREVGKSGCHRTRTAYYAPPPRAQPQPTRQVYYDSRGNPVATTQGVQPVSTNAIGSCRTETRSYYDERGRLTQRPVQICDR